jgi:hypothetical protein
MLGSISTRRKASLIYDYRTNADVYPKWQGWMREKQPWRLFTLRVPGVVRWLRPA